MRSPISLVAAALCVALLPGCEHVSDPMTPEESRAQVVDAGQAIVDALNLDVAEAFFWRSSCNDQGDPPFRGSMRIAYPRAADSDQSQAQIADMAQRLRGLGWTGDPDFHSHGMVLEKDNVVVVFDPQAVGMPHRNIELIGECRDTTTTKETRGHPEQMSFGRGG